MVSRFLRIEYIVKFFKWIFLTFESSQISLYEHQAKESGGKYLTQRQHALSRHNLRSKYSVHAWSSIIITGRILTILDLEEAYIHLRIWHVEFSLSSEPTVLQLKKMTVEAVSSLNCKLCQSVRFFSVQREFNCKGRFRFYSCRKKNYFKCLRKLGTVNTIIKFISESISLHPNWYRIKRVKKNVYI